MVKAILIKPLDGLPEGTKRDFDKLDFERLKKLRAVRAAPAEAKATSAPLNQMAPAPINKAAPGVTNKAVSASVTKSVD